MTQDDPVLTEAAQCIRKARLRRDLAALDVQRGMLAMSNAGMSVTEIANVAGPRIGERDVIAVLESPKPVSQPAPGFSGVGPHEICERYADGQISREQLLDELTRWPYVPEAMPRDEFDDLQVDPPGTFNEVVLAKSQGWIDRFIYRDLQDRRAAERQNRAL